MKKCTLLMGAALLAALSASAGTDVVVKAGETVKLFTESKVVSKTYNFESGWYSGWTTIDADGDGYKWRSSNGFFLDNIGHNSDYCVVSESFMYHANEPGPLNPNNYLVSPIKVKATSDSYIEFYAAAYDEAKCKEHFGVAVSTEGNTDAADFKIIAEWTYGGKGVATQLKGKDISSVKREPGTDWVKYRVDLREYADKEIWIAIRHFNSANQYVLLVDDITIGNYMGYCNWTNDNEVVGMPDSGYGPVEFIALNDASGNDVVANITTQFGENEDSFTITVQPMDAAVAPVEDLKVKDGDKVDVALTVDEGLSVEWTNDNPAIGLDASGTGDISFDAVNKTKEDQVANISVIIYKDVEGGRAYGRPTTFKVTVLGEASIVEDDIVVKAGETVKLFAKGTVAWTCDNTAVGMPASGNGPVEFIALNDASGNDVVANVTAKPADSDEYTFTVTVQPMDNEVLPVEDIKVKDGDPVEVTFFVNTIYDYDFEDGTLQGWTTIDADVDGFNWMNSYTAETNGHNSKYCASSSSVFFDGDLTPDNYLVAPQKFKASANSYISFYASAQDEVRCAENFGVAVSTDGNTNDKDFKTIDQWTIGGVGTMAQAPDKAKHSVVKRTPTDWRLYTVDLCEYAGNEIWIALRHFDCTGQSALNIDDIIIGGVMPVVGKVCEWTNDNPAIGLAASGEGDINFTAVNKTESDIVANITAVPYKLAGDGKAYGQPSTFRIVVEKGESGLTEISKDDNSDALYFTVSGIQVPADRLLPGIYLRLRGNKADKVIVK